MKNWRGLRWLDEATGGNQEGGTNRTQGQRTDNHLQGLVRVSCLGAKREDSMYPTFQQRHWAGEYDTCCGPCLRRVSVRTLYFRRTYPAVSTGAPCRLVNLDPTPRIPFSDTGTDFLDWERESDIFCPPTPNCNRIYRVRKVEACLITPEPSAADGPSRGRGCLIAR